MEARYPIRPCGTIVLCAKQQSDLQEKEKKRKEKQNAKRKEKKIIFDLFVPREKCYEMVSLLPKQEPPKKLDL